MVKPNLKNKDIYPSDKVLLENLKGAKDIWDDFLELLDHDPLITYEWRYYNDGKTWLFKVTRNKKTVFWVSVYDGYFNVTCYFLSRLEDIIRMSNIDQKDKEQFLGNNRNLKSKPITVSASIKDDIKRIEKIMELKIKLK